jgi:hypothetical protein
MFHHIHTHSYTIHTTQHSQSHNISRRRKHASHITAQSQSRKQHHTQHTITHTTALHITSLILFAGVEGEKNGCARRREDDERYVSSPPFSHLIPLILFVDFTPPLYFILEGEEK